MACPLFLPAVSFVSGLVLAGNLDLHFYSGLIWFLLATWVAAWLAYYFKKGRLAFGFLILAFLISGLTLQALSSKIYHDNSLKNFPTETYLDFKGLVLKSPERGLDRDRLLIATSQIEADGQTRKIKAKLQLIVPHSTTSDDPLELQAGDKLEFSASLNEDSSFKNFFPDFMPLYLQSQKIQARAYTKSPFLLKKLNNQNHTFSGFFSRLRRKLQKEIEADYPGEKKFSPGREGAILEALLLGEDGRLDQKTDLQFQKTGLYHLLAISGAHVGVVSGFLFFFLKSFFRSKKLIYTILLMALAFYGCLVEGQPSVFRAVIMASLFFIGKIIFAEVNLLNTISLSALILLCLNPFSLNEAGFQLTFLATLGLILFYQPVYRCLPHLPFKLSELAAMSAAAVVATMPVIVSSFNRVTFASALLTIPATPLVGFLMVAGYLYLLIGLISPPLAHLMSVLMKLPIRVFIWLTGCLEPLSSLSYRLPSPPLFVIIGFYLFLLLLLLKPKFKGQKLATWLAFLIFFTILITYPFKAGSNSLIVTVIDVGQGESQVIEFPGGHLMVIDAGGFPQSTFDPGESIVSPFLWSRGYKKIDYLVSTHLHPDHARGLPAVARNFKIKEYFYTENYKANALNQEIEQALRKKVRKTRITSGLELRPADNIQVEFLYPDERARAAFRPGNDLSAVIRVEWGKISFLFPGDITSQVESYLAGQQEIKDKLKTTIMKVPHHGSQSSSTAAFLEAVAPGIAVASCGRHNIYGFPAKEIVSRLEEHHIKLYRTDLDGAIEFKTDGHRLHLKTARSKAEMELEGGSPIHPD
ncbi:MAG TPA: DNA internalization-related competence protein ComEC/Rec2 [Candidatus Saccharicenans sp.]|jgi:competence protein ComEC|nr:DNA internalization-related competence protein ComEC/Rec2 [Candidatus Saccharicenans sp.]HRD02559.1 DNA internalization-related competence protein ComEC/Rec2 [Candidatus Saccharicenans sp.]